MSSLVVQTKAAMVPFNPETQKEIDRRRVAAGGKSGQVHVSLVWANRNDLDLHVIAPSGERIYFSNKTSKCGGKLDVDMNVSGETTTPVENVFWPNGKAPLGRYKVYVRNYRAHTRDESTPYKVAVVVNGKTRHFGGTIVGVGDASEQLVCCFSLVARAAV